MGADATSLTIDGSYAQVWRTTAKLAVLCLIVSGVILALGLARGAGPDLADGVFLAILTVFVPLILPLYVWMQRELTARHLEVNATGLRLTRFSGQRLELEWSQIVGLRASFTDDYELVLLSADGDLAINSYVFRERDWQQVRRFIYDHLPEDTPVISTTDDLHELLRRWLDRGSVVLLVIVLAAVVGLLLWNPHNAAWCVVLTLSPPVFIFMGVSTPHQPGKQPVPIAKVIGFYAIKALVVIPLGVLWYLYFADKPETLTYRHEWLLHLSNLLFFGAMAIAILCIGGASAWQYYQQRLRGPNRHWKKVLAITIPLMIIGLSLKCWNE